MKAYTLKFKQKVNGNIDDIFSFFSNSENLEIITSDRYFKKEI